MTFRSTEETGALRKQPKKRKKKRRRKRPQHTQQFKKQGRRTTGSTKEKGAKAPVTRASDEARPGAAAQAPAQGEVGKHTGTGAGEKHPSASKAAALPSAEQLRAELTTQRRRERFIRTLRSTVGYLIVVAACAVLVATLLLPVLRIYGTSMTPTLSEGQIVVSVKGSGYETGDIIAFYYEGKILIKRVIATSGSWVDIDDDGNVYVDGVLIDEPYLTEKALGECDIELPYQVPDERVFVMGDHRSTSVDSRSSTIGAVSEEEIVGRIVFRIWPLNVFGPVG